MTTNKTAERGTTAVWWGGGKEGHIGLAASRKRKGGRDATGRRNFI